MKTTLKQLSALIFSCLVLYACSKNDSVSGENNARMQVALTDDPGNFQVVNIDVRDILVNYADDTSKGWVSLNGVRPGNYDVLRLTNGKDTILADAVLNPGKLQQIRLVLGDNNFVKVDGKVFPLQTPSAQQSGLKLKISQQVIAGVTYKLLMDFDASRSIVKTGNGKYILKPVIRTSLEAIGGSIKGFVAPNTFATAVYALQEADTVAGTYTTNGAFMLKGLAPGNYSIVFVPSDASYKKETRSGVSVKANSTTVIDTVRLVK